MADKNLVYLRMSIEDWDLLRETLQTDSRAKNFERSLRDDIADALERVEEYRMDNRAILVKKILTD